MFKHLLLVISLLSATGVPVGAACAQTDLTVRRLDGSEVVLSDSLLETLTRITGTATAHGNAWEWEGTDLRDVLRAAGVTPVDSLRAPQLRRIIMVVGADGYRVVLALSELDPGIGNRRAVLVDRESGAALPPDRGPRRLIVEGDASLIRWVRQVVRLEVQDVS
ncbi:MAG: molybdopterin-dependent oxidoreductase [Gemmatimonadota bacterium]|nr:molybdopterin-dependent oxidoreductase [Gemmatimonadota bacterium]MDH5195939.1 molybdopterin-dependent oxidoreductase [Gemmatimonadota bacterium]